MLSLRLVESNLGLEVRPRASRTWYPPCSARMPLSCCSLFPQELTCDMTDSTRKQTKLEQQFVCLWNEMEQLLRKKEVKSCCNGQWARPQKSQQSKSGGSNCSWDSRVILFPKQA